jgi:conjugative relaxase-like TrwC/TraI family protein
VRTLYACSAGETARYYTRYLEEEPDEQPGQWRGSEAHALGLAGAVDVAQLETLLRGFDPVTGRQLGSPLADRFKADGTVARAVAGYDATFSAPKSLSVWWALTGDHGLLDAHDTAVAAVLDHLEANGATTRIRTRGNRAFVDTGGLTMAAFRQSTSREDDPQIHTHVVISTKVRTADGRSYALDARFLKRKQRTLGGIYQSVLRAEITRRYGVAWGPITNGQAELAAMPPDLLDAFSKRTAQVEDLLDAKLIGFRETEGRDPTRWELAALTREAAADSRRDKTGEPVTDLRQAWREEAGELGWTPRQLTHHLAATPHRPLPSTLTVEEVLDRLSAASSTWLPIDVMRVLCDVLPPDGDRTGPEWMAALERAVAQVTERNTVLDREPFGPVRASDGRSIWIEPTSAHLTDQAILDQEERILAFATTPGLTAPAVSQTVDTTGLDALQADAARAVAGDGGLVLVVGPAGTGKTATLSRAVDDLTTHGRPVFGVAPTAKAARVLAEGAGMRTDTVAKLLHEWHRPQGPRDEHRLPAETTVVVDEAGMLGTGSLDALVALARQQRWRLVLVGDPHQLQAVGRGGMFDELCRSHPTHELTTVHRFTHRWEQAASLDLRTGHPAALDRYVDHQRVHAGTFPTLQTDIAQRWIDAHHAGHTVAVVAETNSHVDALNLAIQTARRDLGRLGRTPAPIAAAEHAFVGDHVVTRHNDRTLRTDQRAPVRNRDRWTVQRIAADGAITVTHHNGAGTVTLPADYVRRHVRLGYAATAHGNQGDTVDIGLAVITPGTSHRSLYVAATRGRHDNQLHVVADDTDHARDVLQQVLTNDRADVPAVGRRRELADGLRRTTPDPDRPASTRPHPTREQTSADRVAECATALAQARRAAHPFVTRLDGARAVLDEAERKLRRLTRRSESGGPVGRLRLLGPLREASTAVESATAVRDAYAAEAAPHLDLLDRTETALDDARRAEEINRLTQRLDGLESHGPSRPGPGRGIDR